MNAIKVEKCFDVPHELEKASILFQKEVKFLSCQVLGVYTYVSEEKGGRRELNQKECIEFFESQMYEEERFEIKQAYDLKILLHQEEQNRFCFELDPHKSKLFLICKEDEYSRLFARLDEVQQALNAYKAIKGVIFKDFSPDYDLKALENRLKDYESGLGGTRRICLEQSEFFSPIVDMHFFFILEEDWRLKSGEELENSSYAAKEGKEVGRLIKGQNGRDGRDLLGEFSRVEKREPTSIQFGSLDEDFAVKDTPEYLHYTSLKDGYVGLNSSGLILIKDFNLDEINHRNMGNLLGGIECGFELNIKAPSVDQDAVGAGIVVEAQRINVNGSIDQGVILRAKECLISGSTHQKSEIYANEVEIAKHKGSLVADKAKVKNCEGGKIECQSGEIEDSVGGELYCREMTIQRLHANNQIFFCSKVEIGEMLGGNNDFQIDSSSFREYRYQIEEIQGRHKRYLELIERLAKIYQKELMRIKKISSAMEHFKAIAMQNAKKGLKTQTYILNAIKQYDHTFQQLQKLSEKIEFCKEQSKKIKDELMPIAKLTLDAKIICQSAWVDQNQVEYVNLIKNARERLVIEDGERANIMVDSKSCRPIRERKI